MMRLTALVLLLANQFVSAATSTCETKRELLIENKLTKVWKTTICPKQQLPFHTHQFARIVIPDESGTLKVIYQSGKEVFIKLQAKKPIYLSVTQGKEAHQDLNIGQEALHVTVIELRQG
ncbi:TPA: hypothetical protein ACPSKE_002031 [Legionella feeleii]